MPYESAHTIQEIYNAELKVQVVNQTNVCNWDVPGLHHAWCGDTVHTKKY